MKKLFSSVLIALIATNLAFSFTPTRKVEYVYDPTDPDKEHIQCINSGNNCAVKTE